MYILNKPKKHLLSNLKIETLRKGDRYVQSDGSKYAKKDVVYCHDALAETSF